jgi:hypothetical protein
MTWTQGVVSIGQFFGSISPLPYDCTVIGCLIERLQGGETTSMIT